MAVKDIKGTIPIPTKLKSLFKDEHDGVFVVTSGRDRRRVCLAISSGVELVIPDWLRRDLKASTAPHDEVAVYISTRPLWLVPGEQDGMTAAIAARHLQQMAAAQAQTFTEPVYLAPKIKNLDNVSELLDLAEGDERR
jgi:hypothetical protein